MFLTSLDILRPVAGVSIFVVEKSTDTKLFSGSSVPTGPVASAGGLVTKDAIKPITVFSADRRI